MVIFFEGIIMRLFLKRDVSLGESAFVVCDELGENKYFADVGKTKVGGKFYIIISDAEGQTAAKIRELPIVGTKTFVFKVNKSHITFVILPTANGLSCNFYGNNWHINGDLSSKNFTIIDVDKSVILRHIKHTDHCELEIERESAELYCVAASICANLINTVEKFAVQAV